MKNKERYAKKNLSVPELQAELRSTRQKYFESRFKHRVTPLTNPMEVRNLRRQIARLKTWMREKELKKA